MLNFKPTFSLSSFSFIKRLFSSSSFSAIKVVSSAYLRLLIFLLAILTPAYESSSSAFHIMYSAYKLRKQFVNIQTLCTPFLILNQSIVHVWFQLLLLVLHTGSQEAGKVVWYSHLFKNVPQFVVIHTVTGFRVVNEAEVDVFLEFSCFLYDPTNAGHLCFLYLY